MVVIPCEEFSPFFDNTRNSGLEMAYMWRGRGPRTRVGSQSGRNFDIASSRYARNDSNIFSCLTGRRGMEGDSENAISSESDTDELFSDNLNASDRSFREVQSKKKYKLNNSSGAGSTLVHPSIDDEQVDCGTLDAVQKLSLILSKMTLYDTGLRV